ncbi:MAG: rhomboid family intramembrane serine protease, partial [Pseudarthrobacter sp.]
MLDAIGDGRPRSRATTASRAKGGLLVSGGFVVVLFVIEVVNMLTLHALNRTFGLRPRSLDGLLDIFTFPLLHANMNHLLSNALPLVVFGFLVF